MPDAVRRSINYGMDGWSVGRSIRVEVLCSFRVMDGVDEPLMGKKLLWEESF